MALLLLRDTAAMGPLLALHLGVVFALFLTMPYGKFVHGIYRYVALVRYAQERQAMGHK
jgi:citrate/tricarballylate utilization protein